MFNFLRSYLKKVRRFYTNPYNYKNTNKKSKKKHRTSYNYMASPYNYNKKSSGYKNNKNNRTRMRL